MNWNNVLLKLSYGCPLDNFIWWSLTRAHPCKRPALISTTFMNSYKSFDCIMISLHLSLYQFWKINFTFCFVQMIHITMPNQLGVRVCGPQFQIQYVSAKGILQAINCLRKSAIHEAHKLVMAISWMGMIRSLYNTDSIMWRDTDHDYVHIKMHAY